MPTMHVLICGAGIAGQTLAWFLVKSGARVTMIEKSHELPPGGQNIDIEAGAVQVLEKMGLLEKVSRLTSTEKGTQMIDATGTPFAPFPVGPGKLSPTSEFEILRADLVKMLYEALEDHEQITYRFGITVKASVSHDQDSVAVLFSNGEEQRFDLLVAADGQWSTTRRQFFPPDTVATVDLNMYAAYCTIPRTADDNDWWNVYVALGSRQFFLRPDPHGTTRAMACYMPRDETRKAAWRAVSRSDKHAQIAILQRDFGDAGWQVRRMLDALDGAPDFYFQAVQQIKMTIWSDHRVVCVGDAAWTPTFLTGMGTSLAIIGAYVLAGELSQLASDEHPSTALHAYETKLRPYVEKTQQLPPLVPGITLPRTAWQRWLLHAGVTIISKIVAIPSLARMLSNVGNKNDFAVPEYPSFEQTA